MSASDACDGSSKLPLPLGLALPAVIVCTFACDRLGKDEGAVVPVLRPASPSRSVPE